MAGLIDFAVVPQMDLTGLSFKGRREEERLKQQAIAEAETRRMQQEKTQLDINKAKAEEIQRQKDATYESADDTLRVIKNAYGDKVAKDTQDEAITRGYIEITPDGTMAITKGNKKAALEYFQKRIKEDDLFKGQVITDSHAHWDNLYNTKLQEVEALKASGKEIKPEQLKSLTDTKMQRDRLLNEKMKHEKGTGTQSLKGYVDQKGNFAGNLPENHPDVISGKVMTREDWSGLHPSNIGRDIRIMEKGGKRIAVNFDDKTIIQDYLNQGYKEDKAAQPVIATDAQGRIVVVDKGAGTAKPVKTAEGTELFKQPPSEIKVMHTSLTDNAKSAQSIREIYNKGEVGPVTGRVKKYGTKFYADADYTKLKNRVGQLRTIIYGLSGKQINESEQVWLKEEIIPNLMQPSENFETTLNEFEAWVNQRKNILEDEYPAFKQGTIGGQGGGQTTSSGNRFTIKEIK